MNPIKYGLMVVVYAWLRVDLVLWLTFRKDWRARYEFMEALFGKKDTEIFAKKRGDLVKKRRKKPTAIILPSHVKQKVAAFLKQNVKTKTGRTRRKRIIKRLIFWGTDKETNSANTESYKTRMEIIDALLHQLFPNSLSDEADLMVESLELIVFSRVTSTGQKGEMSPIVHNTIIKGVGRLLASHFNEINRLSHESMDKLTKVQMIKELNKAKKDTGSLAFSGPQKRQDEFKHKFPLPQDQVDLLVKVLNHYQFSAWPDSREQAEALIESMKDQLGFDIGG